MKNLTRLFSRIGRARTRTTKEHVIVEASGVELHVETLPPAPSSIIVGDLQTWASEDGVALGPVDGVWWYDDKTAITVADALRGDGLVGLQFHGGSYVLGSVKDPRSGFARIPCGLIEHQICSCVLALEYTLACSGVDESTQCFPLQILEALSAYYHLVNTLKVPAHRIILIGDSAGAHLALAMQRYLLTSGCMPSPGGVVLLSPWCDLIAHPGNIQRILKPTSTPDLSGPYFSPALHAPPPNWPPTLIYSGAQEDFAASISTLASQFSTAGVRMESYEALEIPPRYSHDFLIFSIVEHGWPDEVRACWARIKSWTEALRVQPAVSTHPLAASG
ncbi:alpha/beta-hydrolase [Lenzites betulinus]|nr:alpha/beta-hydrolase [Lenzites betulinus]